MADTLTDTRHKVRAPCLLSEEALARLETILDNFFEEQKYKIEEGFQKAVDEELEKKDERLRENYRQSTEIYLRNYGGYKLKERTTELNFKGDKKVVGKNIADVSKQEVMLDEAPIGFKMEFEVGRIRCEISLGDRLWNDKLDISVTPSTDQDAKELYVSLVDWGSTIEQSFLIRYWNLLQILIWPVSLITWLFLYSAFTDTYVRPSRWPAVAHSLLKSGINKDNQDKAIEAILALSSNYEPSIYRYDTPRWFIACSVVMVILCLFFSICTPGTAIGIGKHGRNRLKRYKTYIVVFPVVLTVFLTEYVIGKVCEVVFEWVKKS